MYLYIFILFGFLSLPAHSSVLQEGSLEPPFGIGEKIEFEAEATAYIVFSFDALADMEVIGKTTLYGRPVWHFRMNFFMDGIIDRDDTLESLVRSDFSASEVTTRESRAGDSDDRRDVVVKYDWETDTAVYLKNRWTAIDLKNRQSSYDPSDSPDTSYDIFAEQIAQHFWTRLLDRNGRDEFLKRQPRNKRRNSWHNHRARQKGFRDWTPEQEREALVGFVTSESEQGGNDYEALKAHVAQSYLSRRDVKMAEGTLDFLSVLYMVRAKNLQAGDRIEIPLSDGKEFTRSIVDVLPEIETLEVGGKKYRALHLTMDLGSVSTFLKVKKGEKLELWLSADEKRIPLQIKAVTKKANVTVSLKKYTPAPQLK